MVKAAKSRSVSNASLLLIAEGEACSASVNVHTGQGQRLCFLLVGLSSSGSPSPSGGGGSIGPISPGIGSGLRGGDSFVVRLGVGVVGSTDSAAMSLDLNLRGATSNSGSG